jgi:hypothetical protein
MPSMPAAARAGRSLSVSSCTVVSALVAIWKTSPPTPSMVEASRTARIRSSTKIKSRVWVPSP